MAHTDFERMVVEELKSIETGATEPIAYINANCYTQHNRYTVTLQSVALQSRIQLLDFPEILHYQGLFRPKGLERSAAPAAHLR